MRFHSRRNPTWNISLFHDRNPRVDFGRILVGIRGPAGEQQELQAFIEALSYRFVEETSNPARRLFTE